MSTFFLSAAFVKGKDIYMSLLSFRFCKFSFFYFITCHIMINNVWVFFRYFTENTYTDTLTHVTIVCFMFFNCCTNIFVGGGRSLGGVNFQGLQKFYSNIGRNPCLSYFFFLICWRMLNAYTRRIHKNCKFQRIYKFIVQ